MRVLRAKKAPEKVEEDLPEEFDEITGIKDIYDELLSEMSL